MTSGRRWNPANPLLLLATAAVPAFTAVALRNHYGWEERDALLALAGAIGSAGVLAGAVTLAWRRRANLAIAYAIAAAALVAPLLVLYYLVRMAITTDYS
jgi:glucose-6-phosphate-specific signal transduction histidine kinase